MKKFLWAGFAAMLFALPVQAKDVKVGDAWSRATAPGQDSGMVQAVITSKKAAQLVGASCKCAASVELHSMVTEGGVMKMRQVEAIDLPAGEAVDMGAQGYHLMLIGLKKPLVEGKKIALTLRLRQANGKEKKVKVNAKVRGMTDSKPEMKHDKMKHDAMKHEHMAH
ncbi:copper chaperone PCu(A)C [Ferrigenium sp. UT4]